MTDVLLTIAEVGSDAPRDHRPAVRDAAQAPVGTSLIVTLQRGSVAARSEGELPEASEGGAPI